MRSNVDMSCVRLQVRLTVLLLHSTLPSAEQKKVFERPPKGTRKVNFGSVDQPLL